MSNTIFRVHPSINFARVGSAEEYYIAPETAAGTLTIDKKTKKPTDLFGGLPIKAGTESTPIEAKDLRNGASQPCRQAARFRIYAYDNEQTCYPSNDKGREIKQGDIINGKKIENIVWTVHLANKKANNYTITSENKKGKKDEEGILAYQNGKTPPVRNHDDYGDDLATPERRKKLVIDAGPRCLSTSDKNSVIHFDKNTQCCYAKSDGCVDTLPDYPVSFPNDHFNDLCNPLGEIDTLGQMCLEAETGRLIVVGGYGKASGIKVNGKPPQLNDAIDNDNWFDDTADGSVDAVIIFEDKSTATVVGGWVVVTDPAYAPQTRNVVSAWDDIYSTWVEELALQPKLYNNNEYQKDYPASFNSDILPIFHAAFLQHWNTNLPTKAVQGHERMMQIQPSDDPKQKIPNLKSLIRDPNKNAEGKDESQVEGKMPLSLGDATKSFLSLSKTQYFLLNQWYEGHLSKTATKLGEGEELDKVVLENCLGGRYSPGIELTFIVRDKNLYHQNWQGEQGPFRIRGSALNYTQAKKNQPFLGVGYVPLRQNPVEPGDLCKFMALPWHTDYNSCAVHTPSPNLEGNNTLYWSWPAQRPVSVFPVDKCTYDGEKWQLGGQVFSIRGNEGHGTHSDYPQQTGRYQCYFNFVENWHKVGFIIQGTQIPEVVRLD